jgi:hypothetical protein
LERGLKPLPDGCLGIIIKINLTTNYQLLLNCNKVHRAIPVLLIQEITKHAKVENIIASLSHPILPTVQGRGATRPSTQFRNYSRTTCGLLILT